MPTSSPSTPGDLTPDYSIGDSGHSEANLTAVAISSALVGEMVTESPSAPRRVRGGVNRHALSGDKLRELLEEHDNGPGWVERGMGWWKKRQDVAQQKHLQKLAEEQRRKIFEAEQPGYYQGLTENATFQQLTNTQQEEDEDYHDIAKPSKSGLGVSVQLDVQDSEEEDADFWIPEVKIEEEVEIEGIPFCPYILDQEQRQSVATSGLPPSLAYCRWTRLYSLARDGDSFEAFLRLVEGHMHTLLVVRTTKDEIFGGYADSAWKATHQGNPEFYGSAQAFLFSMQDTDETFVFKWSGANRYIQYVDTSRRMLAFGGGGGSFGLCLESDFQRGSSGRCTTFDNEPLCLSGDNFKIQNVECYGFLTGKF